MPSIKLGIHSANEPADGTNDTSGTDKCRVCGNFTIILTRLASGDRFQLNGEGFHLSKMK